MLPSSVKGLRLATQAAPLPPPEPGQESGEEVAAGWVPRCDVSGRTTLSSLGCGWLASLLRFSRRYSTSWGSRVREGLGWLPSIKPGGPGQAPDILLPGGPPSCPVCEFTSCMHSLHVLQSLPLQVGLPFSCLAFALSAPSSAPPQLPPPPCILLPHPKGLASPSSSFQSSCHLQKREPRASSSGWKGMQGDLTVEATWLPAA